MAKRSLFRTAALAATLLAAAGCIYPYEVDIRRDGELPLVIEGDIHIGGTTTVHLSRVRPFNTEGYEVDLYQLSAQGYIEGEDGVRVEGVPIRDSDHETYFRMPDGLRFDTSALPPGQRYRLHLETLTEAGAVSNVFESDWLETCPAPTIERLSYSKNEEFREMWIGLTMHCHGAHYFRWTFSETWEYHSEVNSPYEYIPQTRSVGLYEPRPNLFYCWASANSPAINIFSTAYQTEDRFEDLSFHTIPLSDNRLQVMYRIRVQLEAMSESAYNYWNNMQQNTNGQGSIFAPTPSEMASNIHCLTDPGLQVMGYLNAAVQTEAEMYYDNALNHYYEPGRETQRRDRLVVNRPDSSAYWYARRYLPIDAYYEGFAEEPSHYVWTPAVCVDCRMKGGRKDKPEGWPNDHN